MPGERFVGCDYGFLDRHFPGGIMPHPLRPHLQPPDESGQEFDLIPNPSPPGEVSSSAQANGLLLIESVGQIEKTVGQPACIGREDKSNSGDVSV